MFGILCLAFVLPGIQKKAEFFSEKDLSGDVVYSPKPEFSWVSWKNTDFQQLYEAYLRDHIGFYRTFIRIYNQIYFSLFREASTRDVVIGKENYLYTKYYIEEYLGMNFRGMATIEDDVKKMKLIQDSLKKKGTDFIFVIAPGKGTYFPEFFPEPYSKVPKALNNHEYYAECCTREKIQFVDFDRVFVDLRNRSKYPLFSNVGIHWTYYGTTLAVDSLCRYIESIREIDMPDMTTHRIRITDSLIANDFDISNALNLLFPLPNPKLAYPEMSISAEGKTKPSAIVVGDSYFWNIYGTHRDSLYFSSTHGKCYSGDCIYKNGLASMLFSSGWFWYYSRQAYALCNYSSVAVDSLDFIDELQSKDLVILMLTDATLAEFSFGFVDKLYQIYTGKFDNAADQKRMKVEKLKADIRKDPAWMDQIRQKARERGISVDSMIATDALWMYEQETKKP